MEIFRQKNVATRITFPIVDADGDIVTGATAPDSETTNWADGSNPGAFVDCTNEITEIGSSGVYYLNLTQSEMNFDYIYVQIKTTSAGAKTQHILINTKFAPISDASGRVDVGLWLGSAPNALVSGRVDSSTGAMAANVVTASAIADGAIDAGAIAADAITAAKVAADVSAEIADAVLDEDMTGHQTQGSLGQAIGDPVADTSTIWDLVNTNLDATISSRSSAANMTTALADLDDIQTRLPAALVSGRIDASVGAMAANVLTATAINADAITAAKIANDAIGSTELSQAAAQKIADEILDRNLAGGGSGNTRNIRNALRALRNRVNIAAGTVTVYQEDDSTGAWTAVVTTTAGNPISQVDPA